MGIAIISFMWLAVFLTLLIPAWKEAYPKGGHDCCK